MESSTLVTGVSGRHGSTGYFVAQNLLQQGLPIRVMFRHHNEQVTEAECILQSSKEKLIAKGVSNLLKMDAKTT